jgi:riboflavin synthase
MFTGLILKTARLVSLARSNKPVLTIDVDVALKQQLEIGASLAVNGVCLTVIEKKKNLFRFNIAAETLRLSNLGDLPGGAALNIELPVTANDFLGGHLVSGHIDGTVRVRAINKGDQNSRFIFSFREREWKKFLILRGSVTLNGVSLTIAEISNSWFAVEIIPHTLASTNLQFLRIGQRVNIELDLIGKYLYNFYQTKKGRIS